MSRLFVALALALALLLTGCSDDDPEAGPDQQPSASDTPDPEVRLPATVAQAITPGHLDPVCPNGRFTEAEDVLGTLPAAYAAQAIQIFTYDCEGLIEQVVWAELPDAEVAAELLDPKAADGASAFVAGTTVLLVAPRVVDEAGLDVAAYFQDLSDNCGCGSFSGPALTGGP